MKQYYIVSTKHTSKGDTALTLWGHNSAGYALNQKNAGVYDEKEALSIHDGESNIMVEKEAADKLFLPASDFGDEYISLPNDITVRTLLSIPEKGMKPKKWATIRMKFKLK